MAAMNAAMRDYLVQNGLQPIVLDTGASGLSRTTWARLKRFPKILRAAVKLAGRRRGNTTSLYIGVSGGIGQVYDIVLLAVGRVRGMRLFLHHHSYAYVDTKSAIFAMLSYVAGPKAIHVVLSPSMGARLKKRYSAVQGTFELSNSSLMKAGVSVGPRSELRTIGFLGNVSEAKGIFDFLEVTEELKSHGADIVALVAGPYEDECIERAVTQRMESIPGVRYLGPVHGGEKDKFFERTDVLLFPSRYVNEAQPLTVFEAMRAGVPVITTSRGSLPEMIGSDCGLVVDQSASYCDAAVRRIDQWRASRSSLAASSAACRSRFLYQREHGVRKLGELLDMLSAGAVQQGKRNRRLV